MADDRFVVGTDPFEVAGLSNFFTIRTTDMAVLSNDGYVITWSENVFNQSTNSNEIAVFYQVFDENGTQQTAGTLQANTGLFGTQTKVIAQETGGFVIVWNSINEDGDLGGIYGQRFFNGGATRGPEFQVNTTIQGDQNSPEIVAQADGGYTVFWTFFEETLIAGNWVSYILFQRYDSGGNAVGTEQVFVQEISPTGFFGVANIAYSELNGTE
ncbi:MAG: hypothetical protein AAF631_01460, partial [Pseudomonadota bacterium]